jgi:hypothetical protein
LFVQCGRLRDFIVAFDVIVRLIVGLAILIGVTLLIAGIGADVSVGFEILVLRATPTLGAGHRLALATLATLTTAPTTAPTAAAATATAITRAALVTGTAGWDALPVLRRTLPGRPGLIVACAIAVVVELARRTILLPVLVVLLMLRMPLLGTCIGTIVGTRIGPIIGTILFTALAFTFLFIGQFFSDFVTGFGFENGGDIRGILLAIDG